VNADRDTTTTTEPATLLWGQHIWVQATPQAFWRAREYGLRWVRQSKSLCIPTVLRQNVRLVLLFLIATEFWPGTENYYSVGRRGHVSIFNIRSPTSKQLWFK